MVTDAGEDNILHKFVCTSDLAEQVTFMRMVSHLCTGSVGLSATLNFIHSHTVERGSRGQ